MPLRQIVLVDCSHFSCVIKIRSAQRDSRNPRRVVTRRSVARRAAEEERACGTLPFSAQPTPHTWRGRAHLINWCTSLPTSSMRLFPHSTLLAAWAFRDFFLELLDGPKANPRNRQYFSSPIIECCTPRLKKM